MRPRTSEHPRHLRARRIELQLLETGRLCNCLHLWQLTGCAHLDLSQRNGRHATLCCHWRPSASRNASRAGTSAAGYQSNPLVKVVTERLVGTCGTRFAINYHLRGPRGCSPATQRVISQIRRGRRLSGVTCRRGEPGREAVESGRRGLSRGRPTPRGHATRHVLRAEPANGGAQT